MVDNFEKLSQYNSETMSQVIGIEKPVAEEVRKKIRILQLGLLKKQKKTKKMLTNYLITE